MVRDIFVIIMPNRAITGNLFIVKRRCPNCGHDRAWSKSWGISCSKCGHETRD